jgi:hypothetical protein
MLLGSHLLGTLSHLIPKLLSTSKTNARYKISTGSEKMINMVGSIEMEIER